MTPEHAALVAVARARAEAAPGEDEIHRVADALAVVVDDYDYDSIACGDAVGVLKALAQAAADSAVPRLCNAVEAEGQRADAAVALAKRWEAIAGAERALREAASCARCDGRGTYVSKSHGPWPDDDIDCDDCGANAARAKLVALGVTP